MNFQAKIPPLLESSIPSWIRSLGIHSGMFLAACLLGNSVQAADNAWTPAVVGNWDTTTNNWTLPTAWVNANNDTAVFGGTGVTVTLTTAITAGGLTFNSTGYTIAGGANVLTLAGATPTITLGAGTTSTISAILAGTTGAQITGAGTLALSGVNTLTGGFNVTGGATLSYTADSSLGGASNGITLNNGTLLMSALGTPTFTAGRTLNFAAGGGAVNIFATAGAPATGKIVTTAANQLTGSGAITKLGNGDFQLAFGNAGLSGNWNINAGVVEAQNPTALGSGSVTVNTGGELVTSNQPIGNNLTLAGGTLSANGAAQAGVYTGTVNVTANSTIAARLFQTPANTNTVGIGGPLTGSGNITVTSGGTAVAASPGLLVLSGNTSGYSGTITLANSAGLGARTPNFTGPTTGVAGVNVTYYNFQANIGTAGAGFSQALLYNSPQTSTRVEQTIGIPQPGANGFYPAVPAPVFSYAGAGGINDAVMWKGLLNVTTAGAYQFSGTNDDNAILYIDGNPVGTLGVIATNTNIGSAITLAAGPHSLVYKSTQGAGGGYSTLNYSGADTGSAVVSVGSVSGSLTTGSLAATAFPAINVTGLVATPSTLDLTVEATVPTLSFAAGTQLNVTSPTVSGVTITGATTLNGAATLANTGGAVTFNGAIGQSTASTLNISGGYLTTMNAANTYSGLTTVTAGELDLNTSGVALQGGLTVNAANANGLINNVKLLQSEQIADGSTVTLTSGILELGANNETVNSLVLNGGILSGTTGVLTASTYNLQTGQLNAVIGSSTGITKNSAGTLIIGKDQTYTGTTTITSGALSARANNALGATGAGNTTIVSAGGALQLQGGITVGEAISINGTGVATDGALRNTGGVNTISTMVVAASNSTIQSDAGNLILAGAPNSVDGSAGAATITFQGAGDITLTTPWNVSGVTKAGSGALIFNQTLTSIPAMTWNAGVLGFSGTQNLGAVTLGTSSAATTWKFLTDPGAGTQPTVPAGTTLVAGFAPTQAFLNTIAASSAGTLALGVDSATNLSLSGSSLGLGANGVVNYSGVLTPNGTAFKFSGAASTGLAPNVLNLYTNLTGANAVNVTGGIVNLMGTSASSAAVGLYSGGVNITGGTVRTLNDPNLGTAGSMVTLNGGTLQFANATAASVAGQFALLGTGVGGAGRTINVGVSGGTLDVTSHSYGGTGLALTQANFITGTASTTLTKSGEGQLLVLNAWDGGAGGFAGTLNLATNSGTLNVLAGGYMRGLAGVTVNSGTIFQADYNTGIGQSRQFAFNASVNGTESDKIGNTIPINLNGGTFQIQGRNVAFGVGAGNLERVGTVTAVSGQSNIAALNAGTGGGELAITTLTRPLNGGTVRFNSSTAALGTTGAAGRIVLTNVDTTGAPAAVATGFLGGWATVNGVDYAAHVAQASAGAAGGIVAYGSTVAGVTPPAYTLPITGATPAAALFVTGTVGNAAAVSTVLGAAGAGQNWPIQALKMSNAAASAITFAGTTGTADTIYLESGGLLTDGLAFARTIGATTSAFTRGRLTAGTTTATTPQELFLHNNSGSALLIHSVILDNPNNAAATVRVVKDLDGLAQLSGTNTYTGGTAVLRGTLEAQSASSLGAGAVTVKNARLTINAAGTLTGAGGITVSDQGELFLNSNTANFSATGDRYTIGAGSTLIGPNASNANQGLNSLTRVASLTAGGQVVLAADSIIGHQNFPNSDQVGVGNNTVKGLGTNSDLYFGLSGNNGSALSVLTVGSGTAWKGLSTDRAARTWQQGTIVANSDFWLQGLVRDGGNVALTLGGDGVSGSYAIINNAGKAINAFVTGQVALTEDSPVAMPGNLNFVVTPGALLSPNRTNSFGSQVGSIASVTVQAGGTLDPGSFVAIGVAANQDTAIYQNLPYPLPSPVNGRTTVEAGGRFLVNDASGIGSAAVGSWTIKTNGILDLGNANAFFGRGNYALNLSNPVDTTGLINAGQFVFESGAVVRLSADNIYKLSQFTAGETNGEKLVYELYNGNRTLTSQSNPFLKTVAGVPTIAPENIRIANGGMITNDEADRSVNQGRGKIILGDGAILAGSNQTFLNITENLEVEANAIISIGTPRWVEGMPKLGGVNLTGPNSNVIPASASFVVQDGATLVLGAVNTFGDTASIQLPTAVTTFPATGAAANQPGNGSTLLINVGNTAEIVGAVTGNGAVISGAAGTFLGMGNGAADYSTNIVFKSANAQNANLYKVGSSKVTMGGVSDSTGQQWVGQGELIYAGAGRSAFAENRSLKGGKLTLDNTGTALNDRLGGNTKNLNAMGGSFELIGNATTAVTENLNLLGNSASNQGPFTGAPGYSVLKVTPGAARTTLTLNGFENFQSAGTVLQRSATWVLNAPSLGNAPGTYATSGLYTINPANTTNGLIQVGAPNFGSNGAFGIGAAAIVGQAGSSVVPTLGSVLGDATGGGATGFVTEDAVTFSNLTTVSAATSITLPAGGGLKIRQGMPVNGPGIPANTVVNLITGDVVTLSNPVGTGAAGNVNFPDSMRLLAASEYASAPLTTANTSLNVKLTNSTASVTGDTRAQTLTFAGTSTLSINGTLPLASTPSRFHLNNAGIFVQPGAVATINGASATNFLQTNGGTALFLHTQGTLNLNATVYSDNAVVKTGAGTLNVGAGAFGAFRGSLQIDDGVVNLGANNSFSSIRGTNGFTTNENLYLNGGTLNLNGNSQLINTLVNNNILPGNGGTLTSSTPASVTVQGAGQFSGNIAGAITLDKVGNNTLLLTSANAYTGNTVIRSGTLQLRDQGALTGTTGVDLYHGATLTLDNSYLANVVDRVPSTVPINARGGNIQFTGAAGQVSSQTFNTLNLLAGRLDFGNNAGGGGASEVTINNLVRPAGTGSSLTINNPFGLLGAAGNTDAIRYFINNTTINGGATAALTLNDGIVGGWAIANGDNFLTNRPGTGLGALGNTTDGYAAYGSTDVTTATATQNVNDGAARTFTASKTINAWRMAPGAAIVNTYNGGVQLTVDTGGMLSNAGATISHNRALNSIGQSITSNSGELDYWVNQNTNGINLPIVGNIDFVKSGGGGMNLNPSLQFNNGAGNTVNGTTTATLVTTAGLVAGMPVSGTGIAAGTTIQTVNGDGVTLTLSQTATATGANTLSFPQANTFTGKTFVNSGLLTGNMPNADGVNYFSVPGDLVVAGAGRFENLFANNIKKTSNVTIVGSGRLDLVAADNTVESLNSITFADAAGASGTMNVDRQTQRLTSTLNLTGSTAVTTNNTNPSTVPFVGGNLGNLGFTPASGASTLNVNAPTPTGINSAPGLNAVGLKISAAISNVPTAVEGGLIKSGTGILSLLPDQTIANAVNTLTVGSITITGLTSTAGMSVGMFMTGTGIAPGAIITAITPNTSITLSQNITTAGTNVALAAGMYNFNQTGLTFNGTTSSLVDVFNVSQGVVRADNNQALGTNSANTTVQSGAVLLGNGQTALLGSIKLKSGSTLGVSIASATFGVATSIVNNQSVLNVPSGDVTISATDYFVQSTNGGNLVINSKLTGAGNIAINGPQLTSAVGNVTLSNPFTSGAGSSDYSGTISVNTNAVLINSPNKLSNTGATGSALGSATIQLNGGRLALRDDGNALANTSNTVLPGYGNNVVLTGDSLIDANRANGTSTGNTIGLGNLSIPSGNKVLASDFNSNGTFTTIANSYQISFDSLDGAGSLIKGGSQMINFYSISPTFTGGITVAGPMGLTVPHSGGLVFNAASTALNDLAINGVHSFTAGKSYIIGNNLTVGNNAGTVINGSGGQTTGATVGAFTVDATAFVSADTLKNNGQIGSVNGTATITANAIMGRGNYQTLGQGLILQGGLYNDGASATRLKVSGDNTVTLTAANSLSTGGAEVQGGVLRVAPSTNATNPLGTAAGGIRVIGVAATTATGVTQPVAAMAGELRFDPGANTISQAGGITNSGLVRASSGTTTISGVISGPGTSSYVPGLLEGRLNGSGTTAGLPADYTATRPANPGNFGLRSEPRMGQQNQVTNNPITGWGDNDTWIYNGQFFDADGKFSFAENIDDVAVVSVDGVVRLLNTVSNQVTSTSYSVGQTGTTANTAAANTGTPTDTFGMGPNNDGWHNIEIRFHNGAGGAGPTAANGFFANFGFGLNSTGATALDGSQYVRPIDPGDGSLFRTLVADKGNVTVEGGATLSAAGLTLTKTLTLNGVTTPALLNLTGTAPSDADTVTVTGGGSQGRLNLAATSVLTAGVLNVDPNATLNLNNNGGSGEMKLTAPSTGTGNVRVAAGKMTLTATSNVNSVSSITIDNGANLNGTALSSVNVSNKTVVVNGTLTGNVTSTAATVLSGSGSITGSTTLTGGTIAPGNSPGQLSFGGGLTTNSTTYNFEIAGTNPATQYDQINVTGALNFGAGNTSIFTLSLISSPTPGDVYYLGLNDGIDPIVNAFNALPQGSTYTDIPSGATFQVTYTANWTGTQLGSSSAGGNDFALVTLVPEPSNAILLAIASLGLARRRRRGC